MGKNLVTFALLAGVLVVLPSGLKAASVCNTTSGNIVQNCGFETGDFTGWAVNASANTPWVVTNNDVNSGVFAAATGCTGAQCIDGTTSQQNSLAQLLTTKSGDGYTLQFAFASGGAPGQELQVLWDGTVVDDLVNLPELTNEAYLNYTLTGLAATGSDTLEFLSRQDIGFNRLDDVIVTDASATPEPGSLLLLVTGVFLLALTLRFSARLVAVRARPVERR